MPRIRGSTATRRAIAFPLRGRGSSRGGSSREKRSLPLVRGRAMHADARTVPAGELVTTEVCVVGAGPAGIVVARELAAAGHEVLLLERGASGGVPPAPATAVNVGIPYEPDVSRSFEGGGSVQRWRIKTPLGRGFGRLRELETQDFERREWVPHSGWPFGKSHLQPYYTRARALFDCPWPSDDPEQAWDEDLHRGPFALKRTLETRAFSFGNPAVFPGDYWRSIGNSERVLALTNAVVDSIRCDGSPSSVSALQVRTSRDHRFSVRARFYVLAAGGIETPRLLLASRDRHAEGMANGHDLVGRFFMEHPHYASGRMIPASREAFEDPTNYDIHMHDGIPLQRKYVLCDEIVRSEGLLGCTFRFEPKPITDSVHTLRYSERAMSSVDAAIGLGRALASRRRVDKDLVVPTVRGAPHVARHVVNRLRVMAGRRMGLKRYKEPRMFWIRAMAEQVPNPESRVRLMRGEDPLGMPLVALDWRITDQDRSSMQRSQVVLGNGLASAGHRVESLLEGRKLPPALSGGMHHMGTTRMDDSPRGGVVDRHCQVHDIDNLFIAGSAVFPTVGYANPTLTILAMSLRLSDRLKTLLSGS
jgi:choline dehydrogenase-like flavoprotein